MFSRKIAHKFILLLAVLTAVASAQRKSDIENTPPVSSSFVTPNMNGFLFGWFDPSRLLMRQSISFDYTTDGVRGYSLASYTNSLRYRLAEPLSLRCDISLIHSPFNSMGDAFTKNISGLYLTRAEIDYRPSDKVLLQLQYRQVPVLEENCYGDFYPDDLMDWRSEQ
jgi:hypothetical protein